MEHEMRQEALLQHGRLGSRVGQLLRSFGSNPSEVACYLETMCVKGHRRAASGCAVAEFLAAVVGAEPAFVRARVFRRAVVVTSKRAWPWTIVRLPQPVRLFVAAFDEGVYPQLLRPEPSAAEPVENGSETRAWAADPKRASSS